MKIWYRLKGDHYNSIADYFVFIYGMWYIPVDDYCHAVSLRVFRTRIYYGIIVSWHKEIWSLPVVEWSLVSFSLEGCEYSMLPSPWNSRCCFHSMSFHAVPYSCMARSPFNTTRLGPWVAPVSSWNAWSRHSYLPLVDLIPYSVVKSPICNSRVHHERVR